jgi:SPP1 family phage portal protein
MIELAIKAAKQGQSALHFFYAEDSDDLQYSIIDGSEFIPIYDSKTGKTLEQVIRYYNQEMIIDGDNKTVTKVEIWHSIGVEYWERIDKTFIYTGFKPILTISTILNDSVKKIENFDFGKVPFAVLKNNQDCLSDINEIKTLIDDYNFRSSLTSNDIAD